MRDPLRVTVGVPLAVRLVDGVRVSLGVADGVPEFDGVAELVRVCELVGDGERVELGVAGACICASTTPLRTPTLGAALPQQKRPAVGCVAHAAPLPPTVMLENPAVGWPANHVGAVGTV